MSDIAYIMYEKEDYPNSTGEVVCFADSIAELARRTKISRPFVYTMLADKPEESRKTAFRKRYEVRKVYL